jgi:hypothetical protein
MMMSITLSKHNTEKEETKDNLLYSLIIILYNKEVSVQLEIDIVTKA